MIYKSISGWRSVVAQLTDQATLDDVSACPTQFQEWIDGTDYRVHVLGDDVFASRIHSTQDDYRYGKDTQIIACDIPCELRRRCVDLTKFLGLAFSGIDLRQRRDGEWYCFEVNPSPGYTCFDGIDRPIARAVARYLAPGISLGSYGTERAPSSARTKAAGRGTISQG